MKNFISAKTNKVGSLQIQKSATGTKEWAVKNVNCMKGCSNNCKYCYARAMASKFQRKSADDWKNEEVNIDRLPKTIRKAKGRIMFPSSHDITSENLDVAFQALDRILVHNDVLIVTKPRLAVVKEICEKYGNKKEQILFRFTIGSDDSETLRYWEPGAPSFEERFAALKFAHKRGFSTSVSAEPLLDIDSIQLVHKLLPYVTETIWLGLFRMLNQRLNLNDELDEEMWLHSGYLEHFQSDEWLMQLYNEFRDHPQIRWKGSIREVVKRISMEGGLYDE